MAVSSIAARPYGHCMTKTRGPGLNSTGNRILLAVAVGWLVWLLAKPEGGAGLMVFGLTAAITYGLATVAAQRSS